MVFIFSIIRYKIYFCWFSFVLYRTEQLKRLSFTKQQRNCPVSLPFKKIIQKIQPFNHPFTFLSRYSPRDFFPIRYLDATRRNSAMICATAEPPPTRCRSWKVQFTDKLRGAMIYAWKLDKLIFPAWVSNICIKPWIGLQMFINCVCHNSVKAGGCRPPRRRNFARPGGWGGGREVTDARVKERGLLDQT